MPSPKHTSPDIEGLMDQIRQEMAQRRQQIGPQSSALQPDRHYEPGTLLRFGKGGNETAFLGSGWSHAEEGLRWTDGAIAEMNFSFAARPGDLVLSFTARPFVTADVPSQDVTASWNGVLIGDWSLTDAKTCHGLILSPVVQQSSRATLRFQLPSSFSPLSGKISADSRQLGLALIELVLRPAVTLGFQV
jgi:hypothetical protein